MNLCRCVFPTDFQEKLSNFYIGIELSFCIGIELFFGIGIETSFLYRH